MKFKIIDSIWGIRIFREKSTQRQQRDQVALSRIFIQGAPSTVREHLFKNAFNLPGSLYPGCNFNRQKQTQVKLKVVPPNPIKDELMQLGYEERNERIGRVLSPHLTIYRPQLTSMLSISQRISGMALTLYVWSLGISALLSSHDMEHYITMIEGLELNGTLLAIGKFILVTPFTFHYWNAFRHIMWSFGNMLKLDLVYSTGYVVMAMTPLSAIGLACL